MRAAEGLWASLQGLRGGQQLSFHPILQQVVSASGTASTSFCQLQCLRFFSPVCQLPHLSGGGVHESQHASAALGAGRKQRHASCRGFTSTNGGDDSPTLKQRIRELMLMVHPDRWAAHPTAQHENERSFKLLNEYLEAAKGVRWFFSSLGYLQLHACFRPCA